ncbi:MAG: squalene synthase HpnC [Pseudomonadota bacterium]
MVEKNSGKGAVDENFPVGSLLIAKPLRPTVMAYYAFARAADDIADDADLPAEDKVARLDRFEDGLMGRDDDPALATARRCGAALSAAEVDLRHAADLLSAFRQDATKTRYADWGELMDYCSRSASPVGRFLLALHGEDEAGFAASDPLCDALQVLNHLQDLKKDKLAIDRVYLPGDWMDEAGIDVDALTADAESPALRTVIDRCLDGTDALIERACALPGRLRSRRLAMESAAIVKIAQALSRALRRNDPIAARVALSKTAKALCVLRGAVWGAVAARP